MPLVAALPDPSEPSVVGFGALIGALVGGSLALITGQDREVRMRWSVDGSYVGTAFTFGLYVLTNVRGAGIL